MDQIQNGPTPAFLKYVLTQPASVGSSEMQELETLVKTFPQCGIFRLLLAKAAHHADAETAAKTLQSAAVYVANRDVLFRLIHQPEQIIAPDSRVFYPPKPTAELEILPPDASFMPIISADEKNEAQDISIDPAELSPEGTDASFIDIKTGNEDASDLPDASFTDIKTENEVVSDAPDASFTDIKTGNEVVSDAPNASFTDIKTGNEDASDLPDASFIDIKTENEVASNVSDASFIDIKPSEADQLQSSAEEEITAVDAEAILTENDQQVEDVNLNFINEPADEVVFPLEEGFSSAEMEQETSAEKEETVYTPYLEEIDEEVYDEITAIEDIQLFPIKPAENPVEETTTGDDEKDVVKEASNSLPDTQDKAEKDMLSSIASIDYFTFNNKFGRKPDADNKAVDQSENASTEKPAETKKTVLQIPKVLTPAKEPETVSKYHDDKMPYTFMWWLDKTRKQYAGTYQPYVQKMTLNSGPDVGPELQQQYIESIFQTKPPHELAEDRLPPAAQQPVLRKEDELIQRFIVEEPHIHPPSSDKLDMENKAKKSSEDLDILVTETLAKIYLDQMHYQKALETYQKLLLKFPEKTRYFTAQIESIEKKIN